MEFDFDVNALFSQTITRTVGGKLQVNRNQQNVLTDKMRAVVDKMGVASAKAQGLNAPITSYHKLQSSNQVLYVMKDENPTNSGRGAIVGILKIGSKRLFLNDPSGVQHEVEPVCVLDFYVHESKQRSGCGKRLFETMLKSEELKPFEVAIDRPSPKFLSFLKKHYSLKSYVNQANNYVVFDQFFTTCVEVARTSRRLSLKREETEKRSFHSPGKQDRLSNTFPFPAMNHSSPNPPFGALQDTPLRSKRDSLSNDFSWCPESVSKSHSMNQPLLSSSRGAQTSRHTYNIITGAPLHLSSSTTKSEQIAVLQSHSQTQQAPVPATNRVRFASRLEEFKSNSTFEDDGTASSFKDGGRMPSSIDIDNDGAHKTQPRAPHLNLRQTNSKNRAGAMFNTSSLHSSRRGNSLSEMNGPMSYSRYSTTMAGGGGLGGDSFIRGESGKRGLLNAAGLSGTSVTHYPPAKNKLKDKWRDYIT